MVINTRELWRQSPIKGMLRQKEKAHNVSHGLSEAGYDIRIAQNVKFFKDNGRRISVMIPGEEPSFDEGRFCIASAMEEFDMPLDLVGIVHDKSTWARQGLSVFNTVIEPGWKGFLTLELVYHGNDVLVIPAGAGIAQVIFHRTFCEARYDGKYQDQENRPVPARES